MNKKQKTIYIIIAIAIAIVTVASLSGGIAYYFYQNRVPEDIHGTYAEATQQCGSSPVIVSEGIYYTPGEQNNELFSTYVPSDFKLSDYPNHKFYCTEAQALKAGNYRHPCCGYYRQED